MFVYCAHELTPGCVGPEQAHPAAGGRKRRRARHGELPSSCFRPVCLLLTIYSIQAITVATKNKLNLSLAVAVGSSIQIAFFVIPVLVLLGWAIGQPLDFDFNTFETLVVFLAGCV